MQSFSYDGSAYNQLDFFVWGLGFFGALALATLRGELHRISFLLESETFLKNSLYPLVLVSAFPLA